MPIPGAGVSGGSASTLSHSLSVGTYHQATPPLSALHANSVGGPQGAGVPAGGLPAGVSSLGLGLNNLGSSLPANSSGSMADLKVAKTSKQANRWSGLWGSSSKVSKVLYIPAK